MPVRTWSRLLRLVEVMRVERPAPPSRKRAGGPSSWPLACAGHLRQFGQRRLPRHVVRARMRLC